ncbi:MAG: hypothetical protein JNM96_07390, partial [Bacteroidia bacterium]|nr:hypothetical protein [Bacteroidia bacterium]
MAVLVTFIKTKCNMFYKNNIKQGKKILVAFFTLTALYSLSQSNNPSPYCSANYSTGCAERFIAQITTAGGGTNIAHTSNACGVFTDGYAYYCNHFVGATAGQAITFTVMVGGITHQYGISAYIDWNGDNVFSTPAEQFALSGLLSVSAPCTFTVTIPPTQANGKYRLRIRLEQWGTANNPCTTFTRGETEDYDIYVGMQPPSPT